jgi:hypothetical protein
MRMTGADGGAVDEGEAELAEVNGEADDTVLDEASEDSLAQIAQVSGELATPGGPNHRKYAEEGTSLAPAWPAPPLTRTTEPDDPKWKKHKKHVFIFSNAGKPIYSR